ncbi:Parathyroid hormone 2 receptor, partial [Ataeniobius toweri]|nr:Parathyroid hormone 2 receptor [Ataeniobius toweri]
SVFTGHAYRKCDTNGSWVFVEQWNKTWTNYSECLRFLQPLSDDEARQDFFERLYVMYTTGYAVSFSSLLVAIVIIGYFSKVCIVLDYKKLTRIEEAAHMVKPNTFIMQHP